MYETIIDRPGFYFLYQLYIRKRTRAFEILACDTVLVTSARIYAIIQANCTNQNCHPGGGAPVIADFSTLANFKSYISSNSTNFKLRVTSANADMPQSQGFPPLPRAVRDSIACWVDKGMPD